MGSARVGVPDRARIFPLLARDFAPLAERLESVAGRLEGLPEVLSAAKGELIGHDGRPVSRLHVETALEQLGGIDDLVAEALTTADEAGDDTAVAEVEPRLAAAARTASEALREFEAHLRDLVLPASEGEGRLGQALFAEKLRHTLQSEMTPADVETRARREFTAVRAEMVRLARDMWTSWLPNRPLPGPTDAADPAARDAADRSTVRDVLDAIGRDHPPAEEILQFCRDELARIEDFVVDRGLIRLADEPLDIRWTPVFMRSMGGAML